MVAAEDVGRHAESGDVPDVAGAVGVGPGDRGQDVLGHGPSLTERHRRGAGLNRAAAAPGCARRRSSRVRASALLAAGPPRRRSLAGTADAEDADEQRREDGLEAHDQRGGRGHDQAERLRGSAARSCASASGPARRPGRPDRTRPAARRRSAPSPASHVDKLAHPPVLGQEALLGRVHLGEQREQHRLEADHHHGRRRRAACRRRRPAGRPHRAGRRARRPRPGRAPSAPGRDEEQPARAVEQQEAQVPPAVAPAAQVRRAAAAVRATAWSAPRARRSRPGSTLTTISLANSMPVVCRSSARIGVPAEAAQPAVEVADRAAEEAAGR